MSSVIIIGGTSGIGLELAKEYAARGRSVVVTGREQSRAEKAAAEVDAVARGGADGNVPRARGLAVDLSRPQEVAAALDGVGTVDRLALVAIERDLNSIKDYDVERAIRLTTLKLVGYHAVVSALLPRFTAESSVLVFGGVAKDLPYAGSTTVSTINAGVVGMTRTLSVELAPVRVNSLHPGIVGDSPFWRDKTEQLAQVRSRSLTDRLPTTAEVVDASVFLLENRAVNGVDLRLDGGTREK
ncbi:SDR family NAD(P)-dependent oxidoreductase [Nonomuraea aridisoli]|uniref:Short-chain dehydrogenase n=1 Tax=Nonomuraea aridisoli TaxID=2070368 RepID=A0A2W2EVX3_9ACTN|nr:SDR family oxidoreductase [Nonomuraea aridisoli]PZG20425.1 short-chain dehydrogenase [Nonomuraea aridisoli]